MTLIVGMLSKFDFLQFEEINPGDLQFLDEKGVGNGLIGISPDISSVIDLWIR